MSDRCSFSIIIVTLRREIITDCICCFKLKSFYPAKDLIIVIIIIEHDG